MDVIQQARSEGKFHMQKACWQFGAVLEMELFSNYVLKDPPVPGGRMVCSIRSPGMTLQPLWIPAESYNR